MKKEIHYAIVTDKVIGDDKNELHIEIRPENEGWYVSASGTRYHNLRGKPKWVNQVGTPKSYNSLESAKVDVESSWGKLEWHTKPFIEKNGHQN